MTPPDSTTGWLLLQLLTLALLVGNVMLVWRRLSGRGESRAISPQPLEVKAAVEWVRRDEWELTMRSHRERDDRLQVQIDEARRQREGDMARIYEILDTLRGQVSGLMQSSQDTRIQTAQLVDRVDRVLATLGSNRPQS